ncbi:MAG: hypothetical protein IPK59_18830 [Rhodospirillaceae bacterium]|nr:hypothetical protein [Rhodospirillaceae bacterium]
MKRLGDMVRPAWTRASRSRAPAPLAQRFGFLELCHDLFLTPGKLLFLASAFAVARIVGAGADDRGDAFLHARARRANHSHDGQNDQQQRYPRHAGEQQDLRHHFGNLARHCSPP